MTTTSSFIAALTDPQILTLLWRVARCAAGVLVLNFPTGPATVSGFIVAERVDAVERQADWALTHVIHEGLKVCAPEVAHAHALRSIGSERTMCLVVAPRLGVLPRTILLRSGELQIAGSVSVSCESCGDNGWDRAAATLRAPRSQGVDLQHTVGATGASAEVFAKPSIFAHGPQPERLVKDVTSRWPRRANPLDAVAPARGGHAVTKAAASDSALRSALAATGPPVVSVVASRQVLRNDAQAPELSSDVINWPHPQILTLTGMGS